MVKKEELAAKLAKYDAMRADLRTLERELSRDCAAYGVATGRWGWRIDHLRLELNREKVA